MIDILLEQGNLLYYSVFFFMPADLIYSSVLPWGALMRLQLL